MDQVGSSQMKQATSTSRNAFETHKNASNRTPLTEKLTCSQSQKLWAKKLKWSSSFNCPKKIASTMMELSSFYGYTSSVGIERGKTDRTARRALLEIFLNTFWTNRTSRSKLRSSSSSLSSSSSPYSRSTPYTELIVRLQILAPLTGSSSPSAPSCATNDIKNQNGYPNWEKWDGCRIGVICIREWKMDLREIWGARWSSPERRIEL